MANLQAIIMAGGAGSRLHPYTANFPKPLMPVGERPVLEILLRQLKHAGISRVVLAVNRTDRLMQTYFGDGERLGMSLGYSAEETPLGTAGHLPIVLDRMEPDFLVLNGDLLTTLDFGQLIASHIRHGDAVTIGAHRRLIRSEFGVLETDPAGRLLAYREKPVQEQLVSMGLYALNREAIRRFLTPGAVLDMPDLIQAMLGAGVSVRPHSQDCVWMDIGTPGDLAAAQALIAENPVAFEPGGGA
jgi:NDP-sugar pyrophosphorylase family protein